MVDVSADLTAIQTLHQADALQEGREAIVGMLEPSRSNAEGPWETVEYTQGFSEVEPKPRT